MAVSYTHLDVYKRQIKSTIFGEEPENLLNEKMDMEAMENPMFCLTNKAKMNGASLLLQEDIRKQIGECL